MSRMKFMNTEIDNLTMQETLERINELILEDKNAFVVTPNVDHIIQLERGGELKEAYQYADLILTDGKPLIWISKCRIGDHLSLHCHLPTETCKMLFSRKGPLL